jgi:DNA-binding NtrC family response regulator
MPDITGLELLKKIRSENPETSVVIITAFGTIETAVEAMKEGAYDYLTKPVDLDELDLILRKIIERNQLISENKLMKSQLSGQNKLVDVIARSKNMENVLNIASRVSDSKATVLIRGESGTGKEILARAIHYSGNRKINRLLP